MSLLHHPHRSPYRQIILQIHLTLGLILALYVILIGATGALLVFKLEVDRIAYPALFAPAPSDAPVEQILATAHAAYPKEHFNYFTFPDSRNPAYSLYAYRKDRSFLHLLLDPHTAQLRGALTQDSGTNVVAALHSQLLLGATGSRLNGIFAAALIVLALTGLIVWWPGLYRWTRAPVVSPRANAKVLAFDLHRALGIWAFAFILIWGVTGVYFAWPAEVRNALSRITTVDPPALPPVTLPAHDPAARAVPLSHLLTRALAAHPGYSIVTIPANPSPAVPLRVALTNDQTKLAVYLDPFTGAELAIHAEPAPNSLGSLFTAKAGELHTGTKWGLFLKIVWTLMGLALPILAVTGFLIYWYRTLQRILFPPRIIKEIN